MPVLKQAQVPPGALSDLLDALRELHLRAGQPSTRALQSDLGRGVASHTSIHKAFTGSVLPSWGLVELLVEAMARQAKIDESAEVERFRVLWTHAARAGNENKEPGTGDIKSRLGNEPNANVKEDPGIARSMSSILPEVINELEAVGAHKAVGNFRIPTGFAELDTLLGGWSRGSLIVIGGRPSSGKTTLLLTLSGAASITYRLPSMVISTEMSSQELQTWILAAHARVPLHVMRTGLMTEEQWTKLNQAILSIADAPILLGSPASFDIEKVRAEVERHVRESGLRLLLIDGLQSIIDQTPSINPLTAETVLRDLKRLAETLKIAIIVSVQAERPSGSYSAVLDMKHLRDHDSIERVADVVIMIDRLDLDDREHPRLGEADLIVIKNRNGPTAIVTVAFQWHYCRFIDITPPDQLLFSPDF